MADETSKKQRSGFARKGGTRYPRLPLEKALEYSAKLVSKTHTSPQSANIIFPGVFGTKADSNRGQIKASALKQYGLLEGPTTAYKATNLAREIVAAPREEKQALLAKACLTPPIFKTLFETYHGDEVTISRIR